jgi:hypothetical protein
MAYVDHGTDAFWYIYDGFYPDGYLFYWYVNGNIDYNYDPEQNFHPDVPNLTCAVSPHNVAGWYGINFQAVDIGPCIGVPSTSTSSTTSTTTSTTSTPTPIYQSGAFVTNSNDPHVGVLMTASPGTWLNSPTSYEYKFVRQDGAILSTTNTYTPVSGDYAWGITVWIRAQNSYGWSDTGTYNTWQASFGCGAVQP